MQATDLDTIHERKRTGLKKILTRIALTIFSITLLLFIAFKVSPWPSALVIRYVFEKHAKKENEAAAKFVPSGISQLLHQQYDPNDKDAFLDIYYPSSLNNSDTKLPVVVWIHGGGWVSGHKEDMSNYCKILSGKGYVVISIDYTRAPEKKYPTPLIQVNNALNFIQQNADRFRVDATKIILAGDSAGAQIAAQTGAIITNPGFAKQLNIDPYIKSSQLTGLLLYCGLYDIENLKLTGKAGWFHTSILWSYLGEKDFTRAALYKTFSIVNHIDHHFPPSFISVGNGDPLAMQSKALARKLSGLKVKVDTVFFANDYLPALPHEYQFFVDTKEAKQALDASVKFLDAIAK